MQEIDRVLLQDIHGAGFDPNVANECAVRTGASYAPVGAIAGGIAGGIATGGTGIVPGAKVGAEAATLFGAAAGWISSFFGQVLGGNPCPTAPAPTTTAPATPAVAAR